MREGWTRDQVFMKSETTIRFIFLAIVVVACHSSNVVYLENKNISAELMPSKSIDASTIDSSYVFGFDTVWRENKPYRIGPNPFAPTLNITFQIARDDSVTIGFTNLLGVSIAEPFRMFLKKGYYIFHPTREDFPSGVYISACIIGKTKWTKKIMFMR